MKETALQTPCSKTRVSLAGIKQGSKRNSIYGLLCQTALNELSQKGPKKML